MEIDPKLAEQALSSALEKYPQFAAYGPRLLALEFRAFLEEVVLLPCQVVRAGRCLIYRLLQWNPWVSMLCRASELLRKLRLT